jgi:hypothetical protein
MDPVLSVHTPEFLLHASVLRDGPRTVIARGGHVRGFVSVAGSSPDPAGWLMAIPGLAGRPPDGWANAIAESGTRRWHELRAKGIAIADQPATVLLTGWAGAHEMGNVAIRYLVSNCELDDDELEWIGVPPDDVAIRFVAEGGDYRFQDSASAAFSGLIGGLRADRERAASKQVEAFSRAIKKKRDASTIATQAIALLRAASGADTVLVAHMEPDGSVEAAAVGPNGATPVELPVLA